MSWINIFNSWINSGRMEENLRNNLGILYRNGLVNEEEKAEIEAIIDGHFRENEE